jgi:uncharacterized membrane protein YphA (DoxX/SURF4 family)
MDLKIVIGILILVGMLACIAYMAFWFYNMGFIAGVNSFENGKKRNNKRD